METSVPSSRPRTPSAVHHLLRPSVSAKPSYSSLHTAINAAPGHLDSQIVGSDLAESDKLQFSSASSISNIGFRESSIFKDIGEDPGDGEYSAAEGGFFRDEEAQRQLRDQLRRTLNHSTVSHTLLLPPTFNWPENSALGAPPRQYFILTDAGKPVFTHRTGSSKGALLNADDTTTIVGVMQAIISVFADYGDKIRFINAGDVRITFSLRQPLYFVYVAPKHEPEMAARLQLEYLHLQILSICTASQIRKLFMRRSNSDLRSLLQGSDSVIEGLIERSRYDMGMIFSSLVSVKMESALRTRAAELIVPPSKLKDILYAILVAGDRVVTLVRPRRHSIHPADLHILLNTITSPSLKADSSSASASWLPICLPKYNQDSFTHTYVSYLRVETKLSFICVCGAGGFESIRGWADGVKENMENDGVSDLLESAARSSEYTVAELGIAGLRHFVYKSKLHIQLTMPVFEDPYRGQEEQARLIALYQVVYDAVHAKSDQNGPLKLQYIRTNKESVLGWVTQPFELFLTLAPVMSKNAAVSAANAVARWVRREESKLFIKDAPVF